MSGLVQIGEVPSPEAEIELPDLQDALLSPAQIDALFADLEAHAQIGEVILKGGATARAAAGGGLTLDDARDAVAAGARGVQIRYLHEGREWWDTLMTTPAGVRLVRIER